jgi:hypothetical protein
MKMTCEAMKVIRETLEMYNLQEKSMQVVFKLPQPQLGQISAVQTYYEPNWAELGGVDQLLEIFKNCHSRSLKPHNL